MPAYAASPVMKVRAGRLFIVRVCNDFHADSGKGIDKCGKIAYSVIKGI